MAVWLGELSKGVTTPVIPLLFKDRKQGRGLPAEFTVVLGLLDIGRSHQ